MGRPKGSTKSAAQLNLLDAFCRMSAEDRAAFLRLAEMQDRAITISERTRRDRPAVVDVSERLQEEEARP